MMERALSKAGLSCLVSVVLVFTIAQAGPVSGSQMFVSFNGLTEEEIWRANGEGLGVRVVLSGLADVRKVQIDAVNNKLLWAELDLGIRRADFDGSNDETLVFIEGGQAVRLDHAMGKMYYLVYNRIWRASLDGSDQELLYTGTGNPQDLALDLSAGVMYWGEPVNSKILRCNLDGSNVQDVLVGHDPSGLALDLSAGKIYWSDQSVDRIRRANLDGSNVEDLFAATNVNDLEIDLEIEKLYYLEFSSVKRANFDGTSQETLLTGFEQARGISVDNTPIFIDGFESGDTTAWSSSVP